MIGMELQKQWIKLGKFQKEVSRCRDLVRKEVMGSREIGNMGILKILKMIEIIRIVIRSMKMVLDKGEIVMG